MPRLPKIKTYKQVFIMGKLNTPLLHHSNSHHEEHEEIKKIQDS